MLNGTIAASIIIREVSVIGNFLYQRFHFSILVSSSCEFLPNLTQKCYLFSVSTRSSSSGQFLQVYVGYSMAHHLRKYIVPKGSRLDPELDVEAQFSRRTVQEAQSRIAKSMRLQCISGWLGCECGGSEQLWH